MATVTHINPPTVHSAPAFSQGTRAGSLVIVGGQNGTVEDGTVLDGLEEQSKQAFRNVLAVLEAAGSGPEHVVKLTIHLAADADVTQGFAAAAQVWGPHPTAITVLRVAGFVVPGALVEIDAIAVVP